jgi:hypothetical protein
MKRTALRRKVGLKPGTRLRVAGKSEVSDIKRNIQALLRERVIERDSGCVLRRFMANCSGPLQAEHLLTRSNSATFADLRNVVCLCQYHHIFWKPQHTRLYWEYIEEIIGPERWKWLALAEADRHRPHKVDWKLAEIALKNEPRQNQPLQ